MKPYEFFLGGNDAEMREIKKIASGCIVHDKNLGWGAKISDYSGPLWTHGPKWAGDENPQYAGGSDPRPVPVLVELSLDEDPPRGAVVIDHHGDRAGEPPAIIQVCKLLGVTPTREQCLIGAMDAGYAYGLEAIGATTEEIKAFLSVSTGCSIGEMLTETDSSPLEVKREAERAITDSEQIGDCIVVRCNHNKTSPITARLYDIQERQNVLILSTWTEDGEEKTEANYYGNGEAVRAITKSLPGGWTGGAGLMPHTPEAEEFWTQFGGSAPDTAFWGITGRHHGEVLRCVLAAS